MPARLDYASPPLRRRIGLFGAVMLGLGSILGTGVFVGLPMATALAGPWVLLAIVLAGLLAFCSAMSSAQLAAADPVAGGTYEHECRLLSSAWGFTAGWTFLLAKSASAATAALAVCEVSSNDHELSKRGIYIGVSLPDQARRMNLVISVVVIMALVGAAVAGLRRTTIVNSLLVVVTIAGLGRRGDRSRACERQRAIGHAGAGDGCRRACHRRDCARWRRPPHVVVRRVQRADPLRDHQRGVSSIAGRTSPLSAGAGVGRAGVVSESRVVRRGEGVGGRRRADRARTGVAPATPRRAINASCLFARRTGRRNEKAGQ